MPVKVKILPSGREFVSAGRSNLLEAGLRSGLALGYGCSNGHCGECLARVLSGQVENSRHHDFRISDEQRASGHILMCATTPVTNVVIEANEASNSHEIPLQQISARVRGLDFINDDVALLHLKTPRTKRLRFLAGQRVRLGGNGMPTASHPVGSCPCDDMNLHFQVARNPADDFSAYVFDVLKKGDPVDIIGPTGDFVLDESSTRPVVFIAWYTGFAPVRSLIEHAISLETTSAMHLLWYAPPGAGHYMDNLCRSWRDALDNFHYVPMDTGSLVEPDLGADSIATLLNIGEKQLADHDFYVAGGESMAAACKTALNAAGVPLNQVSLDNGTSGGSAEKETL